MSLLVKIKKNRLIRQLGKSKEIVASVFALLIFLIVSAVIIKDINPAKENVPDYSELSKNPYVEYEELLNRTNLKKIIGSRQFLEMKYDENVVWEENLFEEENPPEEGDLPEEENPLEEGDPSIEKFGKEDPFLKEFGNEN